MSCIALAHQILSSHWQLRQQSGPVCLGGIEKEQQFSDTSASEVTQNHQHNLQYSHMLYANGGSI